MPSSPRTIVALAAVVACGEPGLDAEQFSVRAHDAHCRWLVQCNQVLSPAECPAFDPDRWPGPDAEDKIARGLWRLDVGAMNRCLETIERRGCDLSEREWRSGDCGWLIDGTRLDGEPCSSALDCVSRECWTETAGCDDQTCCIGTCVGSTEPLPAGIGGPCRYAPCAEGYCDDSTCQPMRGWDEPCRLDRECEPGLACMSGQCGQLPTLGETCGLYCRLVDQTCPFNIGRCVKAGLYGDPCRFEDECAASHFCGPGGICRPREPVGIGESCEAAACADPNAFCDPGTRLCTTAKADGARCTEDAHCVSGICDRLLLCSSVQCEEP